MENVVYTITSFLSVIAAILAWVAKLKWSSEFRNAKEAQLESVKEQLTLVKEQREQIKEFKSDQIMFLYSTSRLSELRIISQELNSSINKFSNNLNFHFSS